MIKRFFPFLKWYEGYNYKKFQNDFIAGLTVALVLIPQSMAYAQLAGLPAYYGLYAAFLPPIFASLFGSSNHLATGPVAVVSLITSVSLEPLATSGTEEFISYAILLALMVGIFQFLLGILKMGIVVNLLSNPVIIGFTNAAALIIATSQLPKILGIHVDNAEYHFQTIIHIIESAFNYIHLPTLGITSFSFIIMILLKRINPKIPNILIAAILCILISFVFGFEIKYHSDLSSIQSSEVKDLINNYNIVTKKIENITSAEKSLIKSEKFADADFVDIASFQNLGENCYKCHTKSEFDILGIYANEDSTTNINELIRLIHVDNLHNQQIRSLKVIQLDYRKKIRTFTFGAVDNTDNKKIFFVRNDIKNLKKSDGNIWRIVVDKGLINDSAITFSRGGDIVGIIPAGLPKLILPKVDFRIVLQLIIAAIIISFLGFMEAISIAKAIAARTGQRLDPNQELIGQGLGNIIGAFGQGYPVSGSFTRSAVNLQSGGITGFSNVLSALFVAITLLFFTPLLYHLPQAVLAAIIMIAVFGLIKIKPFIHAYKTQKYDGIIAIITFVTTLVLAPHLEYGIGIGVILSLGHFIYRRIEPEVALLSRHPDGTFRSVIRFGLNQCQHISLIRFRGSLTFANCNFLEEKILEQTEIRPDLKYIIIIGNGINEIDVSGEEMLASLIKKLKKKNYEIYFSGLSVATKNVFRRANVYDRIGEDHFCHNVTTVLKSINEIAHENSDEEHCPLIDSN